MTYVVTYTITTNATSFESPNTFMINSPIDYNTFTFNIPSPKCSEQFFTKMTGTEESVVCVGCYHNVSEHVFNHWPRSWCEACRRETENKKK